MVPVSRRNGFHQSLFSQQLAIGNVWGDRGLASKSNTALLEKRGIGNGLCPRNVSELAAKLANQQDFREGLKR